MVYGTLLDGIGSLLDALGQDSLAIASAFVVFVLIAALTLMNMLIGVLCEVVSGVAAVEKEELAVSFVKGKLQNIVMGFDTNGDNLISKSEFEMLMKSKEAVKALTEVGVDAEGLVDLAETIFSENYGNGSDCYDKELSFPDFMEVILELRGGNTATIRDLVNLKKFMSKMSGESTTLTNSRLDRTDATLAQMDDKLRALVNHMGIEVKPSRALSKGKARSDARRKSWANRNSAGSQSFDSDDTGLPEALPGGEKARQRYALGSKSRSFNSQESSCPSSQSTRPPICRSSQSLKVPPIHEGDRSHQSTTSNISRQGRVDCSRRQFQRPPKLDTEIRSEGLGGRIYVKPASEENSLRTQLASLEADISASFQGLQKVFQQLKEVRPPGGTAVEPHCLPGEVVDESQVSAPGGRLVNVTQQLQANIASGNGNGPRGGAVQASAGDLPKMPEIGSSRLGKS